MHQNQFWCHHIRAGNFATPRDECCIKVSVGTRGDSYDYALAKSIIGLFKSEVIGHRGSWRSLGAVEYSMLDWVAWFNHRRLLGPIGHVPLVE